MKKFAGNRPLKDIIADAMAQGVAVDDYNYRKRGADHIALGVRTGHRPDGTAYVSGGDEPGCVMLNTVNGCFWGVTDKGVMFDSCSTEHDNEPWFQALLKFFYREK